MNLVPPNLATPNLIFPNLVLPNLICPNLVPCAETSPGCPRRNWNRAAGTLLQWGRGIFAHKASQLKPVRNSL
ncbi:hypothetical protein SBA2_340009 [Acidobacteriia bacterium SbA2]|nr:hypothetical protein SBA2_340009 [Acidobacteriia bacterium SbA2]